MKMLKYFPFGSQYYRAPSPYKDDWENDLKKMSELGFNTVKFWVQWRWNNPAENEFYFDDIDQLMDLAHKYKLRVMLNTIFDVAPAWIYKRYPDASMITLSGFRVGPQTQPHRQIGGLGYCLNNEKVTEHQFRFLAETVKRYKDHPALEIWNVGSEPEITNSMAELRGYADDATRIGDMLCYCEHCITKFKKWVVQKYGSLHKLNQVWNRNYRYVDEIEVPKTRNTFNDLIDWRMFFVHVLGENIKKRFEITKSIDNGKHLLMCHHVFIQGFPITSTANDPWNVGQYGDLHGFTQMDDPMMVDILRSCAKDKQVISAEMLMLPGYTLDMPKNIDENDVKRFIFSGIAGNLKGFIFWQYRPEILGREAPAWGLTYLDGKPTPWLKAFSLIGKNLQRNQEFLLNAKPRKSDIALIYNPENQIFAWASTGNEKSATDSLLGFHKALYENNFNIDFIHPNEFSIQTLNNYKIIIYPFPYVINKRMSEILKEWIFNGGVFISEAYFGGWNIDDGHHEKIIPGYGFEEVFGVKQKIVHPALKPELTNIRTIIDLPGVEKGFIVNGLLVRETYFINTAEVIAVYDDGEPAIIINNFGKGKAIMMGSYIGMCLYRNGIINNAKLISSLVEYCALFTKPKLLNNSKVRVDNLVDSDGKIMLIIRNLSDEIVNDELLFKEYFERTFSELFDNSVINTINTSEGTILKIKLNPKEVKVYLG
ncbi:MAG: beta-galactosidase [Candidatus Anstonellales archaeon]